MNLGHKRTFVESERVTDKDSPKPRILQLDQDLPLLGLRHGDIVPDVQRGIWPGYVDAGCCLCLGKWHCDFGY